MHLALILGRKHDSDAFEVVSGPGNPVELNEQFNERANGDGAGYSELHLHELVTTGGRKSQRFAPPRKEEKRAEEADK